MFLSPWARAEKERNSSAIEAARQEKVNVLVLIQALERAAKHHLLHEGTLDRRQRIQEGESTPPQPAQRQVVVREDPHEPIGHHHAAGAIASTAARVRSKPLPASRITLQLNIFGQFPGIAQSEVEALSRCRMQRLRGVSQQQSARYRWWLSDTQREWESRSSFYGSESARTLTERRLQTL